MITRRVDITEQTTNGKEDKAIDPNVQHNEDGSLTYTLRYPFTAVFRNGNQEREQEFSQLTFRRVNGGDLRQITKIKDDMEVMVVIFKRLAGITDPIFDKIDGEDIEKAMEAIEDFLPGAQKTGKST